jgi:hypothetical protein
MTVQKLNRMRFPTFHPQEGCMLREDLNGLTPTRELTRLDCRPSYRKEAARLGWERCLASLRANRAALV